VLKSVARLLKSCFRATDTCARLGGDEFAVILPHTDSQAADAVYNRIMRVAAQAAVSIGEQELPVSLSIGTATLSQDANSAAALIAAADADMYRVKQASRSERDKPEACPT
jgi:diguanylate cyclase (GGDEF)-like protein